MGEQHVQKRCSALMMSVIAVALMVVAMSSSSSPVVVEHHEKNMQEQQHPDIDLWPVPKKDPSKGKTTKGTPLWDYELPFTKNSDFTKVTLRKKWRPLTEQEREKMKAPPQNLRKSPTTEMGVQGQHQTTVSIEPVDGRIRIRLSTAACKKMSGDAKGDCYEAVFQRGREKLDAEIVSDLQLLPWSVKVPVTARKFYFDIGARDWKSGSTKWFKEHYPGSEEFHASAYEMDKRFESSFPKAELNEHFKQGWEFVNAAVWIHEDGVMWNAREMGSVLDAKGAAGAGLPPNISGKLISEEPIKVRSFDVAKFFNHKFTMEDFVVVKIDIEGAEWPIMQRMIESGAIKYIDEMFFECHVSEATLGIHPRCIDIYNLLRSLGVVCHRWI